jgi:hypothetical protein
MNADTPNGTDFVAKAIEPIAKSVATESPANADPQITRGYFKTCSGLRQKSQLAFKTKGILANPTTMIARF